MGVFIDPSTDWGFKRIFGEKELLMSFLNSLLEGERVITDLSYLNTERLLRHEDDRKVIYDLYCETSTGEHIIVEMQKRRQEHFKDRALYYSACSIADKGTGNAKINEELAKKRANIVAERLINHYGISADRLTVGSKGDEEQPFSTNDWNRVVIMIAE